MVAMAKEPYPELVRMHSSLLHQHLQGGRKVSSLSATSGRHIGASNRRGTKSASICEFNLASEDKEEQAEINQNFEKGIAAVRRLQEELMRCVNDYISHEQPDLAEKLVLDIDELLHGIAKEYKEYSNLFDDIKNSNIPRYSQQRRILIHEREFINQTNKELLKLKRGEVGLSHFLKWLLETDNQYFQRRIPLSSQQGSPLTKDGGLYLTPGRGERSSVDLSRGHSADSRRPQKRNSTEFKLDLIPSQGGKDKLPRKLDLQKAASPNENHPTSLSVVRENLASATPTPNTLIQTSDISETKDRENRENDKLDKFASPKQELQVGSKPELKPDDHPLTIQRFHSTGGGQLRKLSAECKQSNSLSVKSEKSEIKDTQSLDELGLNAAELLATFDCIYCRCCRIWTSGDQQGSWRYQ